MQISEVECGHDHFRSGEYYKNTFKALAQDLERDGLKTVALRLASMYADFRQEVTSLVHDEVHARYRNPEVAKSAMWTRELEPGHAEAMEKRIQELVDLAFEQAAFQQLHRQVVRAGDAEHN